jgi:general secretion pathway protein J
MTARRAMTPLRVHDGAARHDPRHAKPVIHHPSGAKSCAKRVISGFTLIEVLVALSVMAILAVMSWRGLDGMSRAQTQTQARADDVLTLQAGLAQWGTDLDALVQMPSYGAATTLDWNGQVFRMIRTAADATLGTDSGLRVVAWTLRSSNDGAGQWLRWQSPLISNRSQLEESWLRAGLWAQNPNEESKRLEVAVLPVTEWQLFYFRADAWTNPQSSSVVTEQPPPPSGFVIGGTAPVVSTPPPPAVVIPDGVRLVLRLPGGTFGGTITRDWARPTLGGGKS